MKKIKTERDSADNFWICLYSLSREFSGLNDN